MTAARVTQRAVGKKADRHARDPRPPRNHPGSVSHPPNRLGDREGVPISGGYNAEIIDRGDPAMIYSKA